jgi:Coiled-coil domain-containing protein 124 /Oxs1
LDDLFTGRTVGTALAASNIDDALDALSLTTGGEVEDRKAVAGIDRHPERRQKAALAAFEDKRLPELRKEHPGLRLQQYKDLIYKEFQKAISVFDKLIVSHLRIHSIKFTQHIMQLEGRFEILLQLRSGRLSNGLPRRHDPGVKTFYKVDT